MILTTHSLEEADVLCDRVGIMAEGEMLAVGHTYELKRRFGRGYTLVMHTYEHGLAKEQEIFEFVTSMFPTARPITESISGMRKFEVNKAEVVLSKAYKNITDSKTKLGISSWALMETTLEEIFLKLATVTTEFENSASRKQLTNSDKMLNKDITMAERVEQLEKEFA